jgi:hypothetical protein
MEKGRMLYFRRIAERLIIEHRIKYELEIAAIPASLPVSRFGRIFPVRLPEVQEQPGFDVQFRKSRYCNNFSLSCPIGRNRPIGFYGRQDVLIEKLGREEGARSFAELVTTTTRFSSGPIIVYCPEVPRAG